MPQQNRIPGLAARVGIAAYLTENIGLQAEAGQNG